MNEPGRGWPGAAGTALAWIDRALTAAAGLAMVAMLLFTAVDVGLRLVGRPIPGSFEVTGWLSAAAMALALGHAQAHRSHVAMTLCSARLRGRAAAALELLNGLMALALFTLVAVHVVGYGHTLQQTGSLSETLRVAVHPWVYVVGIGFAGLVLALAADVIDALRRCIAAPAVSIRSGDRGNVRGEASG